MKCVNKIKYHSNRLVIVLTLCMRRTPAHITHEIQTKPHLQMKEKHDYLNCV